MAGKSVNWTNALVLFVLDLCLVPWTAVASGFLAGRITGWIVERSGVSFYRSQQPDELAGWLSFLICGLAVSVLVASHLVRHLGLSHPTMAGNFWIPALRMVRDHLILLLTVAGLVLAFTFIGGIPQTGRVGGG